MIEAAGGVVWRRDDDGRIRVLLVHRPRYDDWSLPKGKLDDGESARDAALREVLEETGLRCRAARRLADVRYRDRKGRSKRVRYWEMTPEGGKFRPNHEVDEVRWVPVDRVAAIVSYPRDAEIVDELHGLVRT